MLKVLIADDEKDIVDLIAYLIKDLDVTIAGLASDGLEAYKIILEENPDVVISDIRMPGMTGLELIEKVKQSERETEFIIISGYRDFEYAKTALQYGVQDYLLKPIKEEELAMLLNRLNRRKHINDEKQQADQDRQQRFVEQVSRIRRDHLRKILYHVPIDEHDRILTGENDPLHPVKDCIYSVVTIKLDYIEHENVDFSAYVSVLENMCEKYTTKIKSDSFDAEYFYEGTKGHIAFNYKPGLHLPMDKKKRYLTELLREDNEKYEFFHVTLGVGLQVRNREELHISFATAQSAIDNRIELGSGGIIDASKLTQGQLYYQVMVPQQIEMRVRKGLFELNKDEVFGCLDEVMRTYYYGKETAIQTIYKFSERWIELLEDAVLDNKLLDQPDLPPKEVWGMRINSCTSLKACKSYLTDYMMKIMERCNDVQKSHEARPIREVKEYIEKNYDKGISLDDIGKMVCLNPVYLSTLFKNQTGMNITNYLIRVRMEAAKKLLRETRMSVSAVADRVGYTDTKYFSKIFTKHVGVKPVEYRKYENR
ncbi:response regulator [Ruminococcus gauvreauii]|uniref:response regulator n=1 Tax=Ruminococcus gauvreauii TaxID=438033 RepID=UPI0039840C23